MALKIKDTDRNLKISNSKEAELLQKYFKPGELVLINEKAYRTRRISIVPEGSTRRISPLDDALYQSFMVLKIDKYDYISLGNNKSSKLNDFWVGGLVMILLDSKNSRKLVCDLKNYNPRIFFTKFNLV